jgi:hypothetical protein
MLTLGAAWTAIALCGTAPAETCLCPGDLDADRTVGPGDLGILLAAWGKPPPRELRECLSPDLNLDGEVDGSDLGLLLSFWGECPAATGACCSDAGCKPLTEEECGQIGGTWAGAGVECGPTGPCCFSTGGCEELAEACCAAAGGFFQGAATTCAFVTCVTVDLDVDTDRNDKIDDADDADEADWTDDRGAFFLVNCNDSDLGGDEDGLRFDAAEDPVNENFVIDARGDEPDITPLVVRATGALPAGAKVYLEAPLAEIRSVHLFDAIANGETSSWGGPAEADTTYDITALVDEDDDIELGVEGLYFRFVQPGHPMNFDGFLNLTLVVENAAGMVLGMDSVRLKVAPYLVLPNTQDAQVVYAKQDPVAFPNLDFIGDLTAALPGLVETYDTDTQWAQDPLELGYTETPRTFSWIAVHTLHQGDLPGGDVAWARDLLLDEATGLYRGPAGPASDSGDFGGNIELLPPTTNHPLGRLCIGNTISDWKRTFLESQEVQPPVLMATPPYPANTLLDTKWLAVGHVDETVGFIESGPHKIVIASPRRAYKLLGAPFGGVAGDEPGDEPATDYEIFFADGEVSPALEISGTSGPGGFTIHVPSVDFTGSSWNYVRIVDVPSDPEHPAIGQMAYIQSRGDGFIAVESVQASFDIALTTGGDGVNCAGGLCSLGYNPPTSIVNWFVTPPPGALIVLSESTLFWPSLTEGVAAPAPGFPAASAKVTVKEVRRNAKLRALNLKCQERLDAIKSAIDAAMMGDAVTFVEVPVIFTADADLLMGELVPRSCVAWNPGLANVLVAGGKFVFPAQRGPKNGLGQDRFQKAVEDSLGAANVAWVNDWTNYHTQMGEVHCGTNVRREPYGGDPWWKQWADKP